MSVGDSNVFSVIRYCYVSLKKTSNYCKISYHNWTSLSLTHSRASDNTFAQKRNFQFTLTLWSRKQIRVAMIERQLLCFKQNEFCVWRIVSPMCCKKTSFYVSEIVGKMKWLKAQNLLFVCFSKTNLYVFRRQR